MFIELTKGLKTEIDDEDWCKVKNYKWFSNKNGNKIYARTDIREIGKIKRMYLHRYIMDDPEGMFVDHIDGNTLNNKRNNLRICSNAENIRNQIRNKNNKSGYKGVSKKCDQFRTKPYEARICYNQKDVRLGYFSTPEEAAIAYNEKAKELFGEFARLNNI